MNKQKIEKAEKKVLDLAESWFLSRRIVDEPTPATYERAENFERKLEAAVYKLRTLRGDF